MCYFLYIASPLTLGEVRSMLPTGVVADLASSHDQRALKAIHPAAQTVALLQVGRCSCDLVRPRQPDAREDERHLRERYRRSAVSRDETIKALERHRRTDRPRATMQDWTRPLASFVAEHARNAGPTMYYLHFSSQPAALGALSSVHRVPVTQVLSEPEGWLQEGTPTLVSRS
ncbi:MAG TPA: hypothetical protein VFH40_06045 [Gemmatimonadales bacterium]|nr:hypothetical protein [Gemmatimonadales bacterium]